MIIFLSPPHRKARNELRKSRASTAPRRKTRSSLSHQSEVTVSFMPPAQAEITSHHDVTTTSHSLPFMACKLFALLLYSSKHPNKITSSPIPSNKSTHLNSTPTTQSQHQPKQHHRPLSPIMYRTTLAATRAARNARLFTTVTPLRKSAVDSVKEVSNHDIIALPSHLP